MKYLFLLIILFTQQSNGWWTQKKVTTDSPAPIQQNFISQYNRAVYPLRVYTLVQQQYSNIHNFLAIAIDSRHLITSSNYALQLYQQNQNSLFIQSEQQLIPCSIKYIDLFNGVALLYVDKPLSKFLSLNDFDFGNVNYSEKYKLVNYINPNFNFDLSFIKPINDGIRELFQFTLAQGTPNPQENSFVYNSKNKISGIYLGQLQADQRQYFAPTYKIRHLFEKIAAPFVSDPSGQLAKKQIDLQKKAYLDRFIQQLQALSRPNLQQTYLMGLWKISNLPQGLQCEQKASEYANTLHCQLRLPLMSSSTHPSFDIQVSYKSLKVGTDKNYQKEVLSFEEARIQQFPENLSCKQFRILIDQDDSQLHFCKTSKQSQTSEQLLVRSFVLPVNSQSIFTSIYTNSLATHESKKIIKPIHDRIQRILK